MAVSEGSSMQYLTIWAVLTHSIFFGISAAASYFAWQREKGGEGKEGVMFYALGEAYGLGVEGERMSKTGRLLVFHRDRMQPLVVGIAVFVTLLYWSVLFSEFSGDGGADFRNVAAHAVTTVALLLDMLLVRHRPLPSFYHELLVACCYIVAYLITNMVEFAVTDDWVYPIIQDPLDDNVGIGILGYIGLILLMLCFTYSAWVGNAFLWNLVDPSGIIPTSFLSCGQCTLQVPEVAASSYSSATPAEQQV